jgi:plasmid stabilization system protein ParE
MQAWVAKDNPLAALDLWLWIDTQVDGLSDPSFPRRASQRVADAHELVAHENYIVYFDQDPVRCTVTVRAVVHVARQFPAIAQVQNGR